MTLLHRARRHLQRAHGFALRSGRHVDHRRRHPFARPGPRHDLRAAGQRMAWRSVRLDPLRAGRHRQGAVRTRHLRRAQLRARRLRAAARRRRDHRERPSRWPPICWKPPATTSSSRTARFRVRGTDRAIALVDVAKAFYAPVLLPTSRLGLEASASFAGRCPELSQWLPRLRGRDRSARPARSTIDRYTVVDDCRPRRSTR